MVKFLRWFWNKHWLSKMNRAIVEFWSDCRTTRITPRQTTQSLSCWIQRYEKVSYFYYDNYFILFIYYILIMQLGNVKKYREKYTNIEKCWVSHVFRLHTIFSNLKFAKKSIETFPNLMNNGNVSRYNTFFMTLATFILKVDDLSNVTSSCVNYMYYVCYMSRAFKE